MGTSSTLSVEDAKQLVAELCAGLYTQGHVSGTGGGISIKTGSKIVMAPSGVQKERMEPCDMFVLDGAGNVEHTPVAKPPPHRPPKLSECAPLFMSAYELRNAGAVLHGHSMNAMLASLLFEDEFQITQVEMIKGIAGHGFYDTLKVPIIENTARECELTERLRNAMEKYPKSYAVLVRRHGVYVWGDNWIQAKTQFESYEYLFETAVKMRGIGLDCSVAPLGMPAPVKHFTQGNERKRAKTVEGAHYALYPYIKPASYKYVVLDIEGTVAPISFVHTKMFPYARARLQEYFSSSAHEVESDVSLVKEWANASGRGRIFEGLGTKESIAAACVKICEEDMDADKKSTALKSVQGNIWTSGFRNGSLRVPLFEDVPSAIVDWYTRGMKVYIYSSGSRKAQRDLFGHTTVGDLTPYLQGFFDTTSGSKVESSSYNNIALSLGAENPKDVMFYTDNGAEAVAAREAGWSCALMIRPGNSPLDPKYEADFEVLRCFESV
jgi:methylthioribulose 1-phosphate dehydratase/enolase-phosphatase E1